MAWTGTSPRYVNGHHPAMPIALITGGSSGIGAATAVAFAPGWQVCVCARRAERLAEVCARVAAAGGEAFPVPLDLTMVGAAQYAVAATVERFGGLDALINNAGAFAVAETAGLTAEHIQRLWALNVQAPMLLAQAALPHLIRSRGMIVNVSSVAAEASFSGCGVYSATKSAIETWSRILREELRPVGVRVSVVAPGATVTEAFPGDRPVDPARLCRAVDIAAAIRFLVGQPATANVDRLVITPPGGPL